MKSKNLFSLLGLIALALFALNAFAPREVLNALAPLAGISIVLVLVANTARSGRGLVSAINIAEGTHKGTITKKTDAAVATRSLLFKFGSDGDHVAACGASEIPLGTVDDEASAAEELVAVNILGSTHRTLLMVASEAITVGEAVFTAAAGKIQDLPAGAGTYYQVGYAMQAAAADGDVIEVQPCAPIKTVVP